jgi:hypothetical protein
LVKSLQTEERLGNCDKNPGHVNDRLVGLKQMDFANHSTAKTKTAPPMNMFEPATAGPIPARYHSANLWNTNILLGEKLAQPQSILEFTISPEPKLVLEVKIADGSFLLP